MAYYLNLFSTDDWEKSRAQRLTRTGFRIRRQHLAQHILPGDIFLCYLVGLSRWCGALRVMSAPYEDSTPLYVNAETDPDPFPLRFKVGPIHALAPEQAVPVFLDGLWDALSLTRDFAKGAVGWSNGFRSSLRSISDEDGNLIMEHLAAQASNQQAFPFTARDLQELARRARISAPKKARRSRRLVPLSTRPRLPLPRY